MATKLFPTEASANTHLGNNNPKLNGNTSGWRISYLKASAGAGLTGAQSLTADTVAGPTDGVEVEGTYPFEWISLPLDQAVTISGTVTLNLRMAESDMMANAGAQCVIERLNSQGAIVSTVLNSENGTELGTSEAAQNWTDTPTSTSFQKGDRIRMRVAANDAGGTMAAGHTVTFWYNGTTAGASGDSWIEFTETFGFLETTPSGSQLFLTDVAGPAVGADIEKEMWTSRGDGVNSIVRNTAAGWTSPLQWTDTGGGTPVEWYSKRVQAFTLSNLVQMNIRALESNAAADAGLRAELAVVDADGTNPTIYGAACFMQEGQSGELGTTETAHSWAIAGADLSVTEGQRLRLRVFIDDKFQSPLATGHTATLFYDSTSGGSSGDSWIQLTQTVSEFAGGTTYNKAGTGILI